MTDDTILTTLVGENATYLLPIITGTIVALIGIFSEKDKISKFSVWFNMANVILTVFIVKVHSTGFVIFLIFSVIAIIVMLSDLKKEWEKKLVAFGFGSKTIGAVIIFTGFLDGDLIKTHVEPFLTPFLNSHNVPSSQIEFYAYGIIFGILLGSIWIIGEICPQIGNRKYG